MRRLLRALTMVATLSLVAAACGGGDDGAGDQTTGDTTTTSVVESVQPTPDPTPEPTPADTADDGGESPDIADLEQSVVKIKAEGSFAQPDGSAAFNIAGVGTGFIISSDGIVVTNNHVTTGAALLQVFLAGDDDPVNARLLGASECWDLAVIQLVGDGYTPLEFRSEEATTGLDVFAAGYPWVLEATPEDVDYTLTAGIVSSVTADGETSWASIDEVLEHDARIRGGNSGGPLVDENLDVVGVNYAGVDGADQNFAIAAFDARPIIDRLAAGENVDFIGINGQALGGSEGGIFVSSVESGSPADVAGIEPGDILVTLEDLLLATDGTMSQYCDVLRTQGSDSVMDFEVYRPTLDTILAGQINGAPIDLPDISDQVNEQAGDSGGPPPDQGGEAYTYTFVEDDSGLISVSIPTAWNDIDGSENANFGPSIWASPDIAGWRDTWNVPGIIVESSTRPASDIPVLLEERSGFGDVCEDLGASDYDDGFYVGVLQIYGSCGGTDTFYVILAATPIEGGDYLVRVEVQAVEQRDLEAADEALATFIALV